MWVRVCALVLRWLLFLGVDIINAVRAGCVCWCVFVFVSHSFLYSHILSDAVSNHSTTCCIWLKLHVSVYLLWLLIRKSRRLCHRLCHHCSHRKFLLSSKVVELSLSMIFSYIKKVFSFSVQFSLSLFRSNSTQSDSSTMVCLLSLLLSSWDHSTFLSFCVCFPFVCSSSPDMCVSKLLCVHSVQLCYFCAHLCTLSSPPIKQIVWL